MKVKKLRKSEFGSGRRWRLPLRLPGMWTSARRLAGRIGVMCTNL
jgi:hypothetical protein